MDTPVFSPLPSRGRRRPTDDFKAHAVAACLQPGVSIASVALANQRKANLLRSWVKAHRDQQRAGTEVSDGVEHGRESTSAPATTLVPMTLQTADAQPAGDIQIEMLRQHTVFQITWPTSEATACAQWLREVLR